MRDFLGEEEIDISQAEIIARAMYRVAAADAGVHAHEKEMIDSFYLSCCDEAGVGPIQLAEAGWDANAARNLLKTSGQRDTLIRSALLVAYADGRCSEIEEGCIRDLGAELDIAPGRILELHREIKLMLLGQFEDLKVFRDTALTIGQQLGLSAQEVEEALAKA